MGWQKVEAVDKKSYMNVRVTEIYYLPLHQCHWLYGKRQEIGLLVEQLK